MRAAESMTSVSVAQPVTKNRLVMALSAAGIIFIMLGFLALALPTAREGTLIWQIDTSHAIYLMDIAGGFALGMGFALTWLSGRLWNRQLVAK